MNYFTNNFDNYLDYCSKIDARVINDCDRISTILEMAILKYNQTISDINTKIYIENGSFDDADYLYEEAEEEVSKESTGIIQSFINAIKKLFTSVINKIKSLFKALPEDEDIDVSKEDIENASILSKHFDGLKNGINLIKSGKVLDGAKALVKTAAPELAAVGAIVGVVALKKSNLLKKCDFLTDVSQKVLDALDAIERKMKSNKFTAAVLEALKGGLDALRDAAKKGLELAQRLFKNIRKNNDDIDIGGSDDDDDIEEDDGHAAVRGPKAKGATFKGMKATNNGVPEAKVQYGAKQGPPRGPKNEIVPYGGSGQQQISGSSNKRPQIAPRGQQPRLSGGSNNNPQLPNNKKNNPQLSDGRRNNPRLPGGGRPGLPGPGAGPTSGGGQYYRSPYGRQEYAYASVNDYDYDVYNNSFYENYDEDYYGYEDYSEFNF